MPRRHCDCVVVLAGSPFVLSKRDLPPLRNMPLRRTAGEQGPPAATNVAPRFGPGSAMVGAGHFTSDTASCEAGEVAVGGGYFALGDATHSRVYNDGPAATTGWSVSVSNDAAATATAGHRPLIWSS